MQLSGNTVALQENTKSGLYHLTISLPGPFIQHKYFQRTSKFRPVKIALKQGPLAKSVIRPKYIFNLTFPTKQLQFEKSVVVILTWMTLSANALLAKVELVLFICAFAYCAKNLTTKFDTKKRQHSGSRATTLILRFSKYFCCY